MADKKKVTIETFRTETPEKKEQLQIASRFVAAVMKGKTAQAYLYGRAGTGKTALAEVVYTYILNENKRYEAGERDDYIASVGWINITQKLRDIQEGWKYKEPKRVNTTEWLFDYSKRRKVLIIDDLGAGALNDWQKEILYTLYDGRLAEGYSTITTSNLFPEELQKKVDDRLYRRIVEAGLAYEITGTVKNVERRDW
jgi:DNA replication protein DnaC